MFWRERIVFCLYKYALQIIAIFLFFSFQFLGKNKTRNNGWGCSTLKKKKRFLDYEKMFFYGRNHPCQNLNIF